VGFDDNRKLGRGEVGGRAALPAWIAYMRVALQDSPDQPPTMPAGIVTVRIDPQNGLLAPAGLDDAVFEVFPADRVPRETSQRNIPGPPGQEQTPDTPTTSLGDIF
jgi:penicillin-binding protein 1A